MKQWFARISAFLLMSLSAAAFAAGIDVNKANTADLDSIKGVGPATSKLILDERQKNGNFKDWNDLIERVKGVGEKNAAKLSAAGMTVNGQSMKDAPMAKVDDVKKESKKDTKKEESTKKEEVKAEKKEETKKEEKKQ